MNGPTQIGCVADSAGRSLRNTPAVAGLRGRRLRLARHLGKSQINLVLRSACTTLRRTSLRLDRRRLGKSQINLVLRSACTIFVSDETAVSRYHSAPVPPEKFRGDAQRLHARIAQLRGAGRADSRARHHPRHGRHPAPTGGWRRSTTSADSRATACSSSRYAPVSWR